MDTTGKPIQFDMMIKIAKISIIVILVIGISALHYTTLHGVLGEHIPHRELYFVPILLASFWFGLNFGLVTALAVSLIYAPHVFVHTNIRSNFLPVGFQIIVFNLVAIMLGWLVERYKRQTVEMLAVEKLTVLGRAATAVGYEMKDILGALKRMMSIPDALKKNNLSEDFFIEMSRLEKMVEILSSFVPAERLELFSHDLNEIIRERVEYFKKLAKNSGIKLETNLDEKRCPSQINIDSVGKIVEAVIQNALEFSTKGQTININSHRRGDHSIIEIMDQGLGVKPEHLPNIFMPFFTTKPNGQGLALAACRKTLHDMGGDIQFETEYGKGTAFIITIPREYSGKPLAIDPIETVIRGEKVEAIYRE